MSNIQRGIWNKVLGLIMLIILSAAVVYAIGHKYKNASNKMLVKILTSDGAKAAIKTNEIEVLLLARLRNSINGKPFNKLDLEKVESIVCNHPLVEKADVFLDAWDRINVNVYQKRPIIRVIDDLGRQFYLDRNGNRCPAVLSMATRCRVLTGDLPDFNDGMIKLENSPFYAAWKLNDAIAGDDLLEALIEEIHLDKNENWILIPKAGVEKIIFGPYSSEMPIQLERLKKFYKTVVASDNGSYCEYINLTCRNQVICGNKQQ